jgi:hypothetical protein
MVKVIAIDDTVLPMQTTYNPFIFLRKKKTQNDNISFVLVKNKSRHIGLGFSFLRLGARA